MSSQLRENAKTCPIKEQIITDLASGLSIQIEHRPEIRVEGAVVAATTKVTLYGDSLPYGNRDLIFSADGELIGSGTAIGGLCKPAWPCDPSKL